MNVLKEVWKCMSDGREYTGDKRNVGGRRCLIEPGAVEENIIANWMEQGLGLRNTLDMVNQSRVDRGLLHCGLSAMITAFRRMNPTITRIRKRM